MTIKEIRFAGGYPACKTNEIKTVGQGEMISRALGSNTGSLVTYPPGRYDITPPEFRDPAYEYILTVNQNGTGTLAMNPRHPDSVMTERPSSRKPQDWERSRLQMLNERSAHIIISGFAKGDPQFYRLFRLIFWYP